MNNIIESGKLLVASFSADKSDGRISYSLSERKEELETQLGVLKCKYTAYVFKKSGDCLMWHVPLGDKSGSFTLELEEFHCDNNGAFAYRVLVNDQDVILHTYEPLVKAKLNYFVEIPGNLIDKNEITVTIIYCGDCPVGIIRGWLYHNFDENAKDYGLDEPMQINEYVGENIERASAISKKYSKHKNCFLGVTYHIPYLGMTTQSMKQMIDRDLETAERYNLPVQWMLSHWWSGAAYSPDGRGGYFGDFKYGQLCYDQETGKEHPTTPNMWSNTLWPTMNHQYAEHIYNTKIFNATEYINRRMSYSVCRRLSEPAFIMEWGSGYWFFNNRDGGDFHDNVVAAAQKDEVILSPKKGIGNSEKEWLFRDNARYHDRQTKYYRRALGHTPIEVKNNMYLLPECQYINNIYTHTGQAVLYPSLDNKIPAWLSGIGPHMWASSEMYAFTDRRHYEYGYSNTRLGCANLEITMMSKEILNLYLIQAYSYGMDYVTMFNPDSDGEDASLCALDKAVDNFVCKPPLYKRVLKDVDVLRDFRTGGEDEISAVLHNISVSPDGYLFCNDNCAYVQTDVLLDKGSSVFIECEALLMKSPDDFRVEFSYDGVLFQKADFLSATAPLDWFNKNSLLTYLIDDANAGKIIIKLIPRNKTVTIKAFKILADWQQKNLQVDRLTARQERVRHRLIQKRLSAERLLTEYQSFDGDKNIINKAQNMLANADYKKAIKFLSGQISLLLPISYSVFSKGKLNKTPFEVTLINGKKHCFITLEKIINQNQFEFSVLEEEETTINWVAQEGFWRLKHDSNNVIFIRDENGENKWTVTVPKKQKELPKKIDGIFKSINNQSLLIEIQPFELGECAEHVPIPLTESCVFRRRHFGTVKWESSLPVVGDAIHITLNGTGAVISVDSEYAICDSALVCYNPPKFHGEQHNGLIEMENGQIFEISYNRDYTRLEKGKLKKMCLEMSLEEISSWFKHGDLLKIEYAPYTYETGKLRAQVIKWK